MKPWARKLTFRIAYEPMLKRWPPIQLELRWTDPRAPLMVRCDNESMAATDTATEHPYPTADGI